MEKRGKKEEVRKGKKKREKERKQAKKGKGKKILACAHT